MGIAVMLLLLLLAGSALTHPILFPLAAPEPVCGGQAGLAGEAEHRLVADTTDSTRFYSCLSVPGPAEWAWLAFHLSCPAHTSFQTGTCRPELPPQHLLQTQHGEDRTEAQIEALNEESTWKNIVEEEIHVEDQVEEERKNSDLTEVLIVELNEESTSENIIKEADKVEAEDVEEERGNKDNEKEPTEEEGSKDVEYQEREEEEKMIEDDESGEVITFTEAPVPPLVVNEAMESLPPALAALEYPDYTLEYPDYTLEYPDYTQEYPDYTQEYPDYTLEYPDYSLEYLPDVQYNYVEVDIQDITDRPR